jgi:hypothetical protein
VRELLHSFECRVQMPISFTCQIDNILLISLSCNWNGYETCNILLAIETPFNTITCERWNFSINHFSFHPPPLRLLIVFCIIHPFCHTCDCYNDIFISISHYNALSSNLLCLSLKQTFIFCVNKWREWMEKEHSLSLCILFFLVSYEKHMWCELIRAHTI